MSLESYLKEKRSKNDPAIERIFPTLCDNPTCKSWLLKGRSRVSVQVCKQDRFEKRERLR